MRITFLGAAGGVTGSMHLVEAAGKRLLLDCGLFQGRRDEAWERNAQQRTEADRVHAVLLSHAHIDHSGALPLLASQGFRGRIHMTTPTAPLTAVLLRDAAKIQARDTEHLRKHQHISREPLYTPEHAEAVQRQFQTADYGAWFEVAPGIRALFRNAGHILGSASVHLEVRENGHSPVRVTFTGDFGRRGTPILKDPEALDPAEVVITESTYGARVHSHGPEDAMTPCASLLEAVQWILRSGGKLLIPAFSVGRTQNLLWSLNEAMDAGQIPRMPVFVDSPLAVAATRIMEAHPQCFDEQALQRLRRSLALLQSREVRFTEGVEESKSINTFRGNAVILAGSGMCESGRVLHHLKRLLPFQENCVALSGYQAQHTLGRRLQEGRNPVQILGDEVRVEARVLSIRGFSAHADRDELLSALQPLQAQAGRTFVVHGEPEQADGLASSLKGRGFQGVFVPHEGESVEI